MVKIWFPTRNNLREYLSYVNVYLQNYIDKNKTLNQKLDNQTGSLQVPVLEVKKYKTDVLIDYLNERMNIIGTQYIYEYSFTYFSRSYCSNLKTKTVRLYLKLQHVTDKQVDILGFITPETTNIAEYTDNQLESQIQQRIMTEYKDVFPITTNIIHVSSDYYTHYNDNAISGCYLQVSENKLSSIGFPNTINFEYAYRYLSRNNLVRYNNHILTKSVWHYVLCYVMLLSYTIKNIFCYVFLIPYTTCIISILNIMFKLIKIQY